MKFITIVCTAIIVTALFVCIEPPFGFRSIARAQSNDGVASDALAAAKKAAAAIKSSRVPIPPESDGCYHLVNGQWQETACASDEFIKKHYRQPSSLKTIQSIPHEISGTPPLSSPATPLILSSIEISFTSNISVATETDVYNPPSTSSDPTPAVVRTPNAYSIQDNTNYFNCPHCRSGTYFPAVAGISNSAGRDGDTAWVQFVFQSGDPPAYCIWYVDVTVATNTNNKAGYLPKCVPIQMINVTPLLGPGVFTFWATVIGYDTCSSSTGSNCRLTLVGYNSQSVGDWYAISFKDLVGLSGQWTDVSGTILGQGNGSRAVFEHNLGVQTTMDAYTCIVRDKKRPGFTTVAGITEVSLTGPAACPSPKKPTAADRLSELKAKSTHTSVTGKSNNLENNPPDFRCQPFHCSLSYPSIAPGSP